VPKHARSGVQQRAIARLLKFFADHNYDWARTGHIPAFKAVVDSARFKALPHRADIAPLGSTGRTLPGAVLRQGAIEGILGEELQAAVTGQKPIARALADAERRSNLLLAQID
jgi:multiple sugar transport system substrate-binding protein